MDSYRHNEMTDTWVAMMPGRRGAWKGPPSPLTLPTIVGRCPFCPGHESDTEATVAQVPGVGPWRVRVVKNLYPMAKLEAIHRPLATGGDATAAFGVHEVLVESPEHDVDLIDYELDHLATVLCMYRDRLRALSDLAGVRSVAVFRNRGRRAGSSQPHPHGQLVALPLLGPELVRRQTVARTFAEKHGTSILEHLLERERVAADRLVEETEEFSVLCPYASRENYQCWIVPRESRGSLTGLSNGGVDSLSAVLRRTLRRIRQANGERPYNIIFRLPEVGSGVGADSFWYVDILPRRGGGAGFELCTGMNVVTITPEEAAAALRNSQG